jgi:hypothetical protein
MAWYDKKLMVAELQGPAYLACALVNGDMTGFDYGTPEQAQESLDMLAQFEALVLAEFGPTAYVTGCLDDSDFDVLYNFTPTYRGDVVTYTVLYEGEAE